MSKNEEPNPADADDTDSISDEDPERTVPMDHDVGPSPENVFDGRTESPPPASTEQWEALTPEDLNSQLPDFKIVRMLGRGGMGAVYMAIQKSLDRPVAIKVLPPVFSRDMEFEVRFRREAKAMATLNHPNIIHIHDFGQTDGKLYYFVMEFVDGADLHQLIKQGKVAPDTALKVVIQVCEALQYAHNNGYVHRDVKPANILLTKDGFVKVGDFGLAKLIDPEVGTENEQPDLTMTGRSMGTPNYMAPEQFSAKEDVDHRTDIYSLGVMFYEMLTGEVPRGSFGPPSGKTQLDVRIDDIVLKAMDERPERRYQAAKDVESDVETVRSDPRGVTMARMEKKRRKVKNHESRNRLAWALVSFLVAALVVAGAVWKPWEESMTTADTAPPAAEPAQSVETSLPTVLASKIELPPALASMKKRGGRLRSWTDSGDPIFTPAKADTFDDVIRIKISDWSRGDWGAVRSDGTIIGEGESVDGLIHLGMSWDRDDLRQMLKQIGSRKALTFAQGQHWGMVLTNERRLIPYGKHSRDGSINPKWSEFEASISEQQEVVAISASSDSAIALKKDGTVVAWSLSRTGPATVSIPKEARNIVAVECGNGNFLALTNEGQVVNWDLSKTLSVPDLGMRAVALRSQHGSSVPMSAAQLEDGTWRAWSNRPENDEIVDRINRLGPAVDLAFMGQQDGKSELLWIEPASSPQIPKLTAPKIELPPALAAMKKRGGTLKGWTSDGSDLLGLSIAQGKNDMIALDGPPTEDAGFRWLGIRANGENISNLPDFDRAKQLVALGSHYGVLKNGQLLHCYKGTRGIDSEIKDAVDAETQYSKHRNSLVLQKNGTLKLFGTHWSNPNLSEVRERLENLTDVVKIDQGNSSIVLRANGEIVAWSGYQLMPPDRPLRNIVDVSAVHGLMALNAEGKVYVWSGDLGSESSPPEDLEKSFAIRSSGNVWAAQIADGSWRAWGYPSTRKLVEKINSLGPAIDILTSGQTRGVETLLWIEPEGLSPNPEVEKSSPKIEHPPSPR